MNHEYKYTLIENENEYKSFLISEIDEINDESDLLKFIDKLISIQYYKGLFIDNNEYNEILSNKINEIIDINVKYSNTENEFKYFILKLLEKYDIYLDELKFNIEITDSIKIKSDYLISELDSLYYLDEISESYLDEISVYDNKSEFIESYINELLSCYISDMKFNFKTKSYESFILNYFNYDAYISDLESEILTIYKYNSIDRYIINYNHL